MSSDQLTFFDRNERERSLFEPSAVSAKPVKFSLSKTINASSQKACDQWLIPVFIGEWMFGPNVVGSKFRETVVSLENNVRKGGEYKFKLSRKGQDTEISGEILKLKIPNQIVLSWTESHQPNFVTEISATFDEIDEKTKLKLNVKLPAELSQQKDDIKKTWSQRLTALANKFK